METQATQIQELVWGFETGTLPRSQWTHAAHVTVAFWYLLQDSETALDRLRWGIRNYNTQVGIANTGQSGYHETLTCLWFHLVRHALVTAQTIWGECASGEMLYSAVVQTCGNADLPLRYYSRDRLMSVQARQTWVEPDLQPLPPLPTEA